MLRRVVRTLLLGLGFGLFACGVVVWLFLATMTDWTRDELRAIAVFTLWPFWLLASLCIGTSFVIARRRRRGRGFAVEAKAGGAVSTVES